MKWVLIGERSPNIDGRYFIKSDGGMSKFTSRYFVGSGWDFAPSNINSKRDIQWLDEGGDK